MSVLEIIVLMAYGLVVVDLVFLPVPSEASTYQLLTSHQDCKKQDCSETLLQVQGMSRGRKLWMFLLPTGLTVGVFLLPLLQIFFSNLKNYLFPIPTFEQPIFQGLAAGLILLGSAVTLMSVLEMRRGRQPRSLEQSESPLQVQGMFQYSRNPGLVGNYLLFLGFFLFLPTLVMVLGFGVYLLNMHYRILLEESQLEIRFGKSYWAYRRRVPRYLGGCGRREEKGAEGSGEF